MNRIPKVHQVLALRGLIFFLLIYSIPRKRLVQIIETIYSHLCGEFISF